MQTSVQVQNSNYAAPPFVQRLQTRSMMVGGLFAIGAIIGFVVDPTQATRSWLIGFMYTLGLTMGSLGLLMLWQVTGGRWGVTCRRIWEAATRTLPLTALYVIPILMGMKAIYPWARPISEEDKHLKLLHDNYLNPRGFVTRMIIYFVMWGIMAYLMNRWSSNLDQSPDPGSARRTVALSAFGLIVYFWSMTFAIVDLAMSILPGWNSTIFGLIVIIGQGMASLSLCVLMSRFLMDESEALKPLFDRRQFHDVGKLTFAFVMLWAYMSFSQWLISWAGNLPEEVQWFIQRMRGGWQYVALFLVLFHFAFPFSILLSQAVKKNVRRLMKISLLLMFMRFVDLWWDIAPGNSHEHFHFSWMDAVIPIAMLGIWLAFFAFNYRSKPIVALNDPRLQPAYEEVGTH